MKKALVLILIVMVVVMGIACNDAQVKPNEPVDETQVKDKETVDAPAAQTDTTEKQVEPAPMKDWITVVGAFEKFQDDEFGGVKEAIEASPYSMTVVSTQSGKACGMKGGSVDIEKTIDDVDDPGLGVVVIGGLGSYKLWDNQALISLVKKTDVDNGLVTAICAAPGVLANAGVLDGGKACWSNSSDLDAIMADASCADTGKPVTVHENVITGSGPSAAEAFGAAIVEYLDAMQT